MFAGRAKPTNARSLDKPDFPPEPSGHTGATEGRFMSTNAQPAGVLPVNASLENLRKQARRLQRQHQEGKEEAVSRVGAVVTTPREPLALSEAQFVLARESGFSSWPALVAAFAPGEPGRVLREGDRVWIDGVPRLRWGSSPEPTYLGAMEAALRGSGRPIELTRLMGDSALCFRLRWATRDGGEAWCGSGPAGEWPDEVAALNQATGYVFEWGPPPWSPEHDPEALKTRVVEHIDRGWPILGFGARMDMAVVYGYESGGKRILLSDYWATDDPSVLPLAEAHEIGMFLQRIDSPAPRQTAARAGLELAARRWHEGIVDAPGDTGATYYYGSAAYERWLADLERFESLNEGQRGNLYFLSSWTFSSLFQNRKGHAARYLRTNAEHFPEAARQGLEDAATCYDRMSDLLGGWDPADPKFGFVKQQPIESWTGEVRSDELALLRDLLALDRQAIAHIAKALEV
jgi:hypothetical protein